VVSTTVIHFAMPVLFFGGGGISIFQGQKFIRASITFGGVPAFLYVMVLCSV